MIKKFEQFNEQMGTSGNTRAPVTDRLGYKYWEFNKSFVLEIAGVPVFAKLPENRDVFPNNFDIIYRDEEWDARRAVDTFGNKKEELEKVTDALTSGGIDYKLKKYDVWGDKKEIYISCELEKNKLLLNYLSSISNSFNI